MLYLAVLDITKKWTGRRQGWGQIYPQLALYYGDRNPINYRAGTAVFVTGFTLHFNSNFYWQLNWFVLLWIRSECIEMHSELTNFTRYTFVVYTDFGIEPLSKRILAGTPPIYSKKRLMPTSRHPDSVTKKTVQTPCVHRRQCHIAETIRNRPERLPSDGQVSGSLQVLDEAQVISS